MTAILYRKEHFTMTASQYVKGTLYEINIQDLQTDLNQPRKYFDKQALNDLANSIKDKGILQPILFRVGQDDNLFIVAGERRLQAAKEAGLNSISGLLVEENPDEVALIENILREDLTAMELAEALDRIRTEHDYTQEQLIPIIGKAKSTVSEILSLNNLPADIKDECRKNPKISRQVLLDIARKKSEKAKRTAYEKYKKRISAPKKTRGHKGGRTFQTKYTSKFDKIKTFLDKIKLEKIDAAGRKDLTTLAEKLKKDADDFLKKIKNASAVVKTPPAVKPKPKKEKTKNKPAKKVSKKKAKK